MQRRNSYNDFLFTAQGHPKCVRSTLPWTPHCIQSKLATGNVMCLHYFVGTLSQSNNDMESSFRWILLKLHHPKAIYVIHIRKRGKSWSPIPCICLPLLDVLIYRVNVVVVFNFLSFQHAKPTSSTYRQYPSLNIKHLTVLSPLHLSYYSQTSYLHSPPRPFPTPPMPPFSLLLRISKPTIPSTPRHKLRECLIILTQPCPPRYFNIFHDWGLRWRVSSAWNDCLPPIDARLPDTAYVARPGLGWVGLGWAWEGWVWVRNGEGRRRCWD